MTSSAGPTRPSLIRRLQECHDQHAWQEAWRDFDSRYRPVMVEWARAYLQDKQAAEDVVQVVFLKLTAVFPKFEYNAAKKFRGWLRSIVHNCCVNELRSRQRRPNVLTDSALEGISIEKDLAKRL